MMMLNRYLSLAACFSLGVTVAGAVLAETALSCPAGTTRVAQPTDRGSDRYALRCEAAPLARARGGDARDLAPDTRVLQRHIYENRRNALSFALPKGYRPVWTDGRLNPRRAERTLAPAQPRAEVVPKGYRRAWSDERLNTQRGPRTVAGDASSARIWTDQPPRQLAPQPLDVPVISVELD